MKAAVWASDDLWQQICAEAKRGAAADPVFGAALTTAVLAHDDLAAALADLIARRLAGADADRARLADVAIRAFRSKPELVEAAALDLRGIVRRDPAVAGLLQPLLHHKGYAALQAWRVSNWLWRHDRADTALLLQNEASHVLHVSLHPAARIGSGVQLDHATGIVIGANVVIADDVTILQNVTMSRTGTLPARAPRIGRGVFIGAGASILGDVAVGDFARIGAGTLVTSNVPAGCTAVGNPARLTNCPDVSAA
jgi:serine O-acetyltransferase